jgi:hypothetical protein
MAIDVVIDYACQPKDELTTGGILARLKGRDQAQRIIQVYRDAGDQRDISEMGFELTRATPDGDSETHTVLISDLLASASELDRLAPLCEGCPANRTHTPFGCFSRVNYPISDHAERWLLLQLPLPQDAPLIWSLLGEHLRELNQYAPQVAQIRAAGHIFESGMNPRRRLGEIAMSGDNVFYYLFMQGHIPPARAAMLLLMFNAIPRQLDAPDILKLTPAAADALERYPFQITPDAALDDHTLREIKALLDALYTAWRLNVTLLLDV